MQTVGGFITQTLSGRNMLWGDIDEAIKAERLIRVQRIERLSTICAIFCLVEHFGWFGLYSKMHLLVMRVFHRAWNARPGLIMGYCDSGFGSRRPKSTYSNWSCLKHHLARISDVCVTFLFYECNRHSCNRSFRRIGFCDVSIISKHASWRYRCHAVQSNDDQHWGINSGWNACR